MQLQWKLLSHTTGIVLNLLALSDPSLSLAVSPDAGAGRPVYSSMKMPQRD